MRPRRLVALATAAVVLLWLVPGASAQTEPIVSVDPIVPTDVIWLVGANGAVSTYVVYPAQDPSTSARYNYGGADNIPLAAPVVGAAGTPGAKGYWLVGSDGGIFTYGDARYMGSTGSMRLNQPVVGMAATPDGGGYWLVARDGGIFTFGSASFYGSTGGMRLNQPIVGMDRTPTGHGYYLVAADGGVFSFGDAVFRGSAGSMRLAQPVVGMAVDTTGGGYWLVAKDGGIFTYGDTLFSGSPTPTGSPTVGIADLPLLGGPVINNSYWVATSTGTVYSYGFADDCISCSGNGIVAIVAATGI